jgi:glucose dehydrogenase
MRWMPTAVMTVAFALAAVAPARAETPPRRWRVIADSSLLARGNQGGLVEVGYRLGLIAGVLMPAVDVYVSLDRQMGGRRRVVDEAGGDAGWRDWVGSVRVGRRVQVVKGLWLVAAGGPAIVHASVTHEMQRGDQSSFAIDGTGGVVWGSGTVVASLLVGATVIPFDDEVAVDGMSFTLPARLEPWGGLGVGLLF